jgi:Double zinc ribbon
LPADDEHTARILASLEASDDADGVAAAKLIRDMESMIEHLRRVLSCPSSMGLSQYEPCSFTWDGEGCKCDRCGQLVTAWALLAATALEEISSTSIQRVAESAPPADGDAEPAELVIQRVHEAVGASEPLANAPASARHRELCAGCNEPLPRSARFCPECGRTVKGQTFCLSCSGAMSPNSIFCPNCGTKAA